MRIIIGICKDSVLLLLFVVILAHKSKSVEYNDETYGTDWVYFLDPDGNKFYIDMTVSLDDYQPTPIDDDMNSIAVGDYKVNFWLYTRRNVNDYQVLLANDLASDLNFVVGKPLVMITHGWMSNGSADGTRLIKNAYLEQKDINVVIVDWGDEASAQYPVAAVNLPHLAAKVSEMVAALSTRFAFDGSAVHLIGHSLGAHLMSYVGTQLKESGFTVARITGLDPARPFFEFPQVLDSISSDSAVFVDVIHTNIDILGIAKARGHADFYPNGGLKQIPCCGTEETESFISNICYHSCSHVYYKESIKYHTFKGKKCDGYHNYLKGSCDKNEENMMGETCDPSTRGIFYLKIEKLPSKK